MSENTEHHFGEKNRNKNLKKKPNNFVYSTFNSFFFGENQQPQAADIEDADLPEDVVRFEPNIENGLSTEQVNSRVENDLCNNDSSGKTKTIQKILFDNIFTFFNVLLTLIAVALIIFGLYTHLAFFLMAVLNTVIAIVQEIKAKHTLDKLKLVTASSVQVVRDGQKKKIDIHDLVLDDIYFINPGDQVPADSIVLDGDIEVNESLLTGESLPIKKKIKDKIYGGSYIVSGHAACKAILVGKYNYISSIQHKAKTLNKPKSEILQALNRIIKIISLIIIPLGILTFFTQYRANVNDVITNTDWEIVSATVASVAGSMVGMIPSGMYLLTSVALASSVVNLGKKQAMVQDIYSVEMLARVDVLCLDKTGTLTDGTMEVEETIVFDESYDLDKLVGSYLNAFPESNQTSLALLKKYSLRRDYLVSHKLSFSSARKYSAVEFKELGTFILGAPEYLYKGNDPKIINYITQKEKAGERVIMLCHCDYPIVEDEVTGHITPVAVFTLRDQIREDASATISWFQKNGVAIKIISGDNPLTASEIAQKVGVRNAEKCVSLEGLSEREVIQVIDEYTVFGRVSPEQKAIIIKSLRSKGHTVGMTGDGVNDILAMKNADCSVAMANGASAARNAAHLVLLDSKFSSMPVAVLEGRRAINNIQKSSALYLMKTIFTIVFTLIALITFLTGSGIKYPFSAQNMLPLEMVCIGFTSFVLAAQQNGQPIKGHFMTETFIKAIPAAVCMILAIGLNYVLAATTNVLGVHMVNGSFLTAEEQSSFTTFNALTLVAIGFGMDFHCYYPMLPLSNPESRYRFIFFFVTFGCLALMLFGFGYIPSGNSNMCQVVTGVDFRFLNSNMWIFLVCYLFGFALILNLMIYRIGKFREERKKAEEKTNELFGIGKGNNGK